jgi:hypothetical protein
VGTSCFLKKVQLYDITLLYMLGTMQTRMFNTCIKPQNICKRKLNSVEISDTMDKTHNISKVAIDNEEMFDSETSFLKAEPGNSEDQLER